uniref:Uncharacterized protein n=1 Tax=Knipowitschia caucasica TaxID=637954 RepID=A0AAV2KRN9_KNICA
MHGADSSTSLTPLHPQTQRHRHRDSAMGPTEVQLTPPSSSVSSENRLRWDLTPQQILDLSHKLISDTKKVYDVVGELPLEDVSFDNTLKALADVEVEYTGEPTTVIYTGVM